MGNWPADKIGFRQRGMDMTRLETFTDAAFAFALTLLVISIDSIPKDLNELIDGLKQAPAFAASFAIIMLFWYGHHLWSRRFGMEDAVSMIITFLLVFFVLLFVYPLKMIFSGAFEFFSGGALPSIMIVNAVQEIRDLFVIYGSGFAVMSLTILALNWHALRCAGELQLSDLERYETRTSIGRWTIYGGVAVLSCLLAVFLPDGLVALAGMCYFLYAILMPWHDIRREKQRPPATV